jgi:D-alanyl-D-alanine carboxypeptidase (penicillin-binding protein 5/6)
MRTGRYTRSNHNNKTLPMLVIITVCVLIISGYFISKDLLDTTLAGNNNSSTIAQTSRIDEKKLYSESAVLMDVSSGKVIYTKNENEKLYPASLTKIMTTIVSITERESLDTVTTISEATLQQLRNENASMAGYDQGEETTVEDLTYACMLPSGADAACGLAQVTAGGEDSMAEMMNDKADEIGMTKTNFTNVTGLHNDNQYTTTKDMAKLLKYALSNPVFKEVFTSDSHSIKTDVREFTVHSTFFTEYMGAGSQSFAPNNNSSDSDDSSAYSVKGAKTGTTSDAGQCLASLVEKDGTEYILVTLKAPLGGGAQPYSFEDLDYVFSTI